MPAATVLDRVRARARVSGVDVGDELATRLATYLELLARWNAKINLTAFDLREPSDAAIDRLIIEPLVAARHLQPSDRIVIDIGSGGGSPAIPLKLAAPSIRLLMTEARVRKAAFLREAVRVLELEGAQVEAARVEPGWVPPQDYAPADVVTIRAVRLDGELSSALHEVVRIGGIIIRFTAYSVIQQNAYNAWPDWVEVHSAGPFIEMAKRIS